MTKAFAVYVAAASTAGAKPRVAAASTAGAKPRVVAAIASLRAHGFLVTCTWPVVVATVGNANPRDASDDDRRGWATQCLNEIDAADAVWFLVPEPPETTRGGWGEALYAYSERKHLVFSGDTKQSVFCALGHEFATDAAALRLLRELLRELRDRERLDAGLRDLRDAEPIDMRLREAMVGFDGEST